MARIRSVKPELRRDLTVAEWPREVRYGWVLLWGYLDDHGRGLDDLRLLVADLFPLDRDVTEKKLDGWLVQMCRPTLHGAPPLCRYEVSGRRYLHAPKWVKSQRVSHPQTSQIPPCPMHECGETRSVPEPEPLRNDSGTAPTPFATSRAPEDLGVKGAREQGAVRGTAASVRFEEFWTIYPRREGKGAARKAWVKATAQVDASVIIDAARAYADDPARPAQFTPHASTWLNGERWTDEPQPSLPIAAGPRRGHPALDQSSPTYDPHLEHLANW